MKVLGSIRKYKSHEVSKLLMHNNRKPNDNIQHENEFIDLERTKYNYYYKKGTTEDVSKRLDELFFIQKKNTNVMAEVIFHLPKDVKEDDERDFFEAIYDYFVNYFGDENIINAVVHKDEGMKDIPEGERQPHIHIDLIPTVTENKEMKSSQGKVLKKWKEEQNIPEDESYERLDASESIDRAFYQNMHPEIEKFVEKRLGYKVAILTGSTEGGNKTVVKLKTETLKKEQETLERKIEVLKKEMNKVYIAMQKCEISPKDLALLPLLRKIEHLDRKVNVLQDIIRRNDVSYTKNDLEQMLPIKYEPVEYGSLSICNGSLCDLNIESNAMIIIELYSDGKEKEREREREREQRERMQRDRDRPERMPFDREQRGSFMRDRSGSQDEMLPSPQKALIDRSPDLKQAVALASKMSGNVIIRKARSDDKRFVMVKVNDDPRTTIDRLIEMNRAIRKDFALNGKRKIYMDRMKTDEFDFAQSSLLNTGAYVCYCTRLEIEEKWRKEQEEKESEEAKKETKQFM